MNKLVWIIATLLLILSFTLRFYKFENVVEFDWDQNRDYGEVQQIARGKYVILGPVAKGSGGFYLGSLYYYLLYPAYTLMHGSLYALPLISLTLDSFMVVCIYLLLHKSLGKKNALLISIVWVVSWLTIASSRVSWNVALVPIWSLLTTYSLFMVIKNKSLSHFYFLGFLFGLTIHIHVAVILLIPIFGLFYFRHFRFPLRSWVIMLILAIIPVIPLIAFDLKHGFMNAHLLRDQLSSQVASRKSFSLMASMSMIKLGKVVSGIFLGKFVDNIYLGFLTILLALKAIFWSKNHFYQLSGLTILIATILIIGLGDYGFPEYYFAGAYLAIIAIYTYFITLLSKPISLLMVVLIIYANLRSFSTVPSGFSLKYKYDLVESLKTFKEPIDISYQFDPGRDGGFRYIVNLQKIKTDPNSKTRILLTDKFNTPLYIDGELARDLEEKGNFKSALYIVQ